ncbi:hypothetical protein V5799_013030 [Amblyomma americanum]|uniref:Uncharacterized protein n=1 Tax=Amblyomma americanum TaxID=6943 RepID=A0AAQ4E708_AMBAM
MHQLAPHSWPSLTAYLCVAHSVQLADAKLNETIPWALFEKECLSYPSAKSTDRSLESNVGCALNAHSMLALQVVRRFWGHLFSQQQQGDASQTSVSFTLPYQTELADLRSLCLLP